jgi:hypothetical protein
MKAVKRTIYISFIGLCFVACSSNYQWRYSNFSQEETDSLLWSDGTLIESRIPALTSTNYRSISRGSYTLIAVKGLKRYTLRFFISGKGSGKKSMILDATGQFSIAEND